MRFCVLSCINMCPCARLVRREALNGREAISEQLVDFLEILNLRRLVEAVEVSANEQDWRQQRMLFCCALLASSVQLDRTQPEVHVLQSLGLLGRSLQQVRQLEHDDIHAKARHVEVLDGLEDFLAAEIPDADLKRSQ